MPKALILGFLGPEKKSSAYDDAGAGSRIVPWGAVLTSTSQQQRDAIEPRLIAADSAALMDWALFCATYRPPASVALRMPPAGPEPDLPDAIQIIKSYNPKQRSRAGIFTAEVGVCAAPQACGGCVGRRSGPTRARPGRVPSGAR